MVYELKPIGDLLVLVEYLDRCREHRQGTIFDRFSFYIIGFIRYFAELLLGFVTDVAYPVKLLLDLGGDYADIEFSCSLVLHPKSGRCR